MRITFKVTPGGREDYLAKFPVVEGLDDVKTDGAIDVIKVRRLLKPWTDDGFLTWGDDSRPVLAFVVELFRQLTEVSKAADRDDESNAHISPKSKHDETMSRRYDRGNVAFVRIDVGMNRSWIRVRVSTANPKGVVGDVLFSVRDFATYLARILAYIAKSINESAEREIVHLEGVGNAADVFERAEYVRLRVDALDEVKEANKRRAECTKRWQGEFCSPIEPGCRCFSCGKCVEATLPEKFKSFENYKITKG